MKKNNSRKDISIGLFIIFIVCWNSNLSWAQQCNAYINASTPSTRFTFTDNGKVLDHHTHLQWARCSVGQKWNEKNSTCEGTPKLFTWQQAKQYALKNKQYWRLPSIHELSSIVELSCEKPAINQQVFPNTPAGHYWTNTPFINSEQNYWLVQFDNGENHTDSGKRTAFLRLVKNVNSATQQAQRKK